MCKCIICEDEENIVSKIEQNQNYGFCVVHEKVKIEFFNNINFVLRTILSANTLPSPQIFIDSAKKLGIKVSILLDFIKIDPHRFDDAYQDHEGKIMSYSEWMKLVKQEEEKENYWGRLLESKNKDIIDSVKNLFNVDSEFYSSEKEREITKQVEKVNVFKNKITDDDILNLRISLGKNDLSTNEQLDKFFQEV